MFAHTAGRELHEVIPIVCLFPAACPVLLEIVEDWLPLVIVTASFGIVIRLELLVASLVGTLVVAILR